MEEAHLPGSPVIMNGHVIQAIQTCEATGHFISDNRPWTTNDSPTSYAASMPHRHALENQSENTDTCTIHGNSEHFLSCRDYLSSSGDQWPPPHRIDSCVHCLQSHVYDRWCTACHVHESESVTEGGESWHETHNDELAMTNDDEMKLTATGLALLQVSSAIVLVQISQASFTDEFLDLAWPLTVNGERDLSAAADVDPESLRLRWQVITTRNNIPRPINVASYMLHRPPSARSPRQPFILAASRFDDPYLLPGVVEAQWPDLQMATWRLHQCYTSITTSRTWDNDVWHFMLLDGREQSMFGFPTGIIEIVSRYNEDECSFAYSATVPAYATWAHLWSWLGIGNDFSTGTIYQIQVNGENIEDPVAQLSIGHGFFVQITAMPPSAGDPLILPADRSRRLQGDLCLALPSGNGNVYRAGPTIHDTELARLPYGDRTRAILNRWPHLSVWTMYKIHQTARGRRPAWAARDDAVLIRRIQTACTLLCFVLFMTEVDQQSTPLCYIDTHRH